MAFQKGGVSMEDNELGPTRDPQDRPITRRCPICAKKVYWNPKVGKWEHRDHNNVRR